MEKNMTSDSGGKRIWEERPKMNERKPSKRQHFLFSFLRAKTTPFAEPFLPICLLKMLIKLHVHKQNDETF